MEQMMNAVADKTATITARQLRAILFELTNQEMTIEELRKKLYALVEQDKEVKVTAAIWWQLEVE